MSKGWKYGLIKVAIEEEGTDCEEQVNLLVELYPLGENGEYNSFCTARIQSIEELQNAQADVKRDGINTWFYDNGTFTWDTCKNCMQGEWSWIAGNTKWYNCAHCDAGYPDQECTCGRTKNENKQSFTSEE